MVRRLTLILLLMAAVGLAFAQPYGNEWINPNQTYFKIPIGQDGLYRVGYADLAAAGFPVTTVDPRRIQLFHRGVEQAIYIAGQVDASFDASDYLEFFGYRNDGTLDRELYVSPEAQPHDYYNLFSDTTAYFLTWRLDNGSGERMDRFQENNVTAIPPVVAHWSVSRRVFINSASFGRAYPEGRSNAETFLAAFDYGEGWTGGAFTLGQSETIVFTDIAGGVSSSTVPRLRLVLQGRNNRQHNVTIAVGPDADNLRVIGTAEWSYYNTTTFESDLAWTDVSESGQVHLRYTVNGVSGVADRMSVSVADISFPQNLDVEGDDRRTFGILPNGQTRAYVELSNVPTGARFFDVSNPDQPREILYNRTGTNVNWMAPIADDTLSIQMETELRAVARIAQVAMPSYDPFAEYIILTHPGLHSPSTNYSDPVQAYADYRSSMAGGGYSVQVVDVSDLYNLFSYGEISPLAIRRFMDYQLNQGDPKYLFLIGKSRYWFNDYHRQTSPSAAFPSWFPAMGYPGSDALYTYNLDGKVNQPAVPTGRINAITSQDIEVYLDKIKELEADNFDDPWRKRLLHLSGGATSFELGSFARYVQEFAALAEDDFLGADVEIFSKTSDAVVEVINVSETVNEGVGVLLMFGHSGAQRTDIDIGYVSNPLFGFDNQGRYPLIFVNGCNAGDIFQGFETFGEDWITTPALGASAVIAHSATGFSIDLRKYSRLFYEIGFADTAFAGSTIAEVMQEVSKQYIETEGFLDERDLGQVQQMVLQGDPAIKLFGPTQPDVRVAEEGASLAAFDGASLSADADSIRLDLLVENAGITSRDTLWISVSRRLPNGTTLLSDTMAYAVPKFLDTLSFSLINPESDGAGLNTFTISLDPQDSLEEFNETNNQYVFDAFVPTGTHLNLIPEDFSVVTNPSVRLIAQANNLLAPARALQFQIDTVSSYSSPYLQSTTINSAALMEWEVNLLSQDSTVYYWRTRFADLQPGEDTAWQNSSFVYTLGGEPGWAQSHPGQLSQNSIAGLVYDEVTGEYAFETNDVPLAVEVYGDEIPGVNRTDVQVTVAGQPYIFAIEDGLDSIRFCRDNSVNAIAFDRQSGNPYLVVNNGGFDLLNVNSCGRRPQIINNFLQSDITGTSRELNRYVDGVAEGDWVLFFTIGTIDPAEWPADVIAALAEVGLESGQILAVAPGEPFVFLGQKGMTPNTEWFTGNSLDTLEVATNVFGQFTEGTVSTPRIGPATQWETLFLPRVPLAGDDAIVYDLLGIRANGQDTVLMAGLTSAAVDLSAVDPAEWPQLRLRARLTDETDFSPPLLRQWWVSYTAPPEGLLLPGAEVLTVEAQEGESIAFPFQFINLSGQDFADSLAVRFQVTNQNSRRVTEDFAKIAPVMAGDTARFSYSGSSVGLGGVNDLEVRVNEDGSVVEQRLVNNALQLADLFSISRDSVHPLLDVMVDGRYILDGELVSPSPMIGVRLRDENALLPKEDTIGVQLFFKSPCEGCDFERIAFTDPRINWTPASEEEPFQLQFHPRDLADGRYVLRVQATDASGNESGTEPYQVSFSVVNASTITRFYPYPNPFSTSCRFVFTLTGATVPDEIKIQVLTVSGRVVREITQDELGPIHIGDNLTEYAWDGTDTWGQKLANGVYLYRVIVRNEGETVDLSVQDGIEERAFTRDFGKLYILR